MVLFDLIIQATCTGIDKIQLPQENEWHFMIKCAHCHEDYNKEISFRDTDCVEHKGDASHANFVWKCKNCERVSAVSVHKESPRVVKVAESGKVKDVIAIFQCRGIELVKFIVGETLTVVTENGVKYEDIDVSDLWAEYDAHSQQNVEVENVKFEIHRRKN